MLINLENKIGLGIKLDEEKGQLVFDDPQIAMGNFIIKTAADMKNFIKNKEAKPSKENIAYIYRNLRRKMDESAISESGLRYDITIIPPGEFSHKDEREFFRTAGHYHAVKPGAGIPYPEVYEVINGKALLLLQKPSPEDFSRIAKIYFVEAVEGEKAVIIPGFGHVTINTGSTPLIVANWIYNESGYNHEPFKKYRGGAYWFLQKTDGSVAMEKNTNYSRVPDIKKIIPKEMPEFGLYKTETLYRLIYNLAKLRFLSHPEEFKKVLTLKHCYQ